MGDLRDRKARVSELLDTYLKAHIGTHSEVFGKAVIGMIETLNLDDQEKILRSNIELISTKLKDLDSEKFNQMVMPFEGAAALVEKVIDPEEAMDTVMDLFDELEDQSRVKDPKEIGKNIGALTQEIEDYLGTLTQEELECVAKEAPSQFLGLIRKTVVFNSELEQAERESLIDELKYEL